RRAERGRAGRGGGNRQWQHRDRIDHSQRRDRERDRLETDANSTQPAERSDLDQIVEPERQHRAARRRRADGREAARLVGLLAGREQPPPATRPQDEAGEVTQRGGRNERHSGMRERPARLRQPLTEQDAGGDRDEREADTGHDAAAPPHPRDSDGGPSQDPFAPCFSRSQASRKDLGALAASRSYNALYES